MTHHPSFGLQLSWDPAGGTAFAAIAQVKDFTGPSISRGDIDVTDHDSPSGYKQYLPGLVEGGEFTWTLGWDPHNTAHGQGVGTGLIGDFEQDGCTLPTFRARAVTCLGTADWTWAGYVKGFTPAYPVEGELTSDVTVKVNGKPTLTVT